MTLVTAEPCDSHIHSNLAWPASRNVSRNPEMGELDPFHFLWNCYLEPAPPTSAWCWDAHPTAVWHSHAASDPAE